MMNEIEKLEIERRLEKYPGIISNLKDPSRYDHFSAEDLAQFCRMKDRTNSIFTRRLEAAQAVIDQLARRVGIDPDDCGLLLYCLDPGEESPIAQKMDEYFSRSGEKARLKKRLDELENENRILRSLITTSPA